MGFPPDEKPTPKVFLELLRVCTEQAMEDTTDPEMEVITEAYKDHVEAVKAANEKAAEDDKPTPSDYAACVASIQVSGDTD